MSHSLSVCPACGEPIEDGYCANCGPWLPEPDSRIEAAARATVAAHRRQSPDYAEIKRTWDDLCRAVDG